MHWEWVIGDDGRVERGEERAPVIGVVSCTFVGNGAPQGGALAFRRLSGTVLLHNVTAVSNVATTNYGGVVWYAEPRRYVSSLVVRSLTAWWN